MPVLHNPLPGTPSLGKHRQEHHFEGSDHIYQNFMCNNDVNLHDLVFIGSTGILERACGNDISNALAIGMVVEKPSTAEARVKYSGLIFDYPVVLVKGRRYFMSTTLPGRITDVVPQGNVVLRAVGIAYTENTLLLDLSSQIVIRRA